MFEIGPALREARERRGLAYAEVEAGTAIRSRYIRALEEEDFGVLPGPTYTKGFLRAYAEYLGLDGQLFVDEFNSRHHDPRREFEQSIYPRPRSQPQQRRRQRRESNLVVIALAAIVAVASLIFLGTKFPGQHAAPVTPPATGGGHTGGQGTVSPPTLPTTPATSQPATSTPAKPRPFVVTLTAAGRCWVAVHVGSPTGPAAATTNGTDLEGYVIDPAVASSIRVRSRAPLFLSQIGAPSSLTVAIDGHRVALPPGTTQSSVLRLTRSGIAQA
jgi:cytoskeletal protein RodZ